MARYRDTFASALQALRRRLRDAVDAPGEALPIKLVAEQLNISTTPVREALARLAGERLVDKKGPTYSRPQLDATAIAQLYRLRLVLIEAALTAATGRGGRVPPVPAPASLDVQETPAETIEALLLTLVLRAEDLILAQAYQAVAQRLAPLQRQEAELLFDLAEEAAVLAAVMARAEPAALRSAVRRCHRRRIAIADAISRLSVSGKYSPDMI